MAEQSMKRRIERSDILDMEQYGRMRRDHRREIADVKRNRRLSVGPFATFYFENYQTMWHQVHEMLFIERGGEDQIQDELSAYNPLIPQGDEVVATVMFEIDDAERRKAVLSTLGGVEHAMIMLIDGQTIRAVPDNDRENSTEDGKASSVQFVHFRLDPASKAKFLDPNMQIIIGFDHPSYGHLAILPPLIRQSLSKDFA